MIRLPKEVVDFFQGQGFVIVSTIDSQGFPHNSCKGIVDIDKNSRVYLIDLYRAKTYRNLKRNSRISITAVNEHRFKGYCLKGRAAFVPLEKLGNKIIKAWEERLTSRIAKRLIKNLREEKGHPHHPEALFPKPEYLIAVEIKEIINLA